ncbi:hypothetical protein [Micropruina glycogenica]|uniref:Uncharacterized protein n=1 Tax=Micropruina glycogenica TaxID=75385 RepID=A0A2N9JBZ2_9ACTN|nr:hypothetical protein [Micropruina glycogenica]SPD85273.1 conserved protein of unknown function [Micropruina glycogenica]
MSSTLKAGGGSSASAWAVHSVCARYRGTDPLVTGQSRRRLAAQLHFPDVSAGIPDARWTRAMIFERLCHDAAFAGEVTARAAGWSGFARPTSVARIDCGVSTDRTLTELAKAAERAADGTATLLYKLAAPYPGFAPGDATNVLPDLAVVANGPDGPSLIVGDVKDYERVRSRIDDGRLLKGFLQVAMGAFAFRRWDALPAALTVSSHGFLAVPRSAFLQPTVEVEDLTDHLAEVEAQWRSRLTGQSDTTVDERVADYVTGLPHRFDPSSCPSCSLFNFCRHELRESDDPDALLEELGVPENEWPQVRPVVDGHEPLPGANASTVARVRATVTGVVASTGQRRLDPVGRPGAVNVVAVKSDAAALGFHGVGVSRETDDGPTPWRFEVFVDPQSDETRRRVMAIVGKQIELAMGANLRRNPTSPDPVHVVVPDGATADLLASIADQLAGVEISRLRWKRDQEMRRPILTFDGEPAVMPRALEGARRTAVSFLLEHDRARMLTLRDPVVDLTGVLARHFVPGGSWVDARRLDYQVAWVTATEPVDYREVSDRIEASDHTPGARLGNDTSNAVHHALREVRRTGDVTDYENLVTDELRYKAATVDAAIQELGNLPDSKLQPAYRSLEGDAQKVWRRRKRLRASDLVRFGRTYAYWRNLLVDVIQADDKCATQLAVLSSPVRAAEKANDPGDRDVTWATVVSARPLTLDVASRRFTDGERVVLLACGTDPWVETDGVTVTLQAGAIKLRAFPLGPLEAQRGADDRPTPGRFRWAPAVVPPVRPGDRLIVARLDWFNALRRKEEFNVERPKQDDQAAPKTTCDEGSYAGDADVHRWCCKPHELVEADFADDLALRRARNELNPQVWPPVLDDDGFEVPPAGKPTARTVDVPDSAPPEGVTVDELE